MSGKFIFNKNHTRVKDALRKDQYKFFKISRSVLLRMRYI